MQQPLLLYQHGIGLLHSKNGRRPAFLPAFFLKVKNEKKLLLSCNTILPKRYYEKRA